MLRAGPEFPDATVLDENGERKSIEFKLFSIWSLQHRHLIDECDYIVLDEVAVDRMTIEARKGGRLQVITDTSTREARKVQVAVSSEPPTTKRCCVLRERA